MIGRIVGSPYAQFGLPLCVFEDVYIKVTLVFLLILGGIVYFRENEIALVVLAQVD